MLITCAVCHFGLCCTSLSGSILEHFDHRCQLSIVIWPDLYLPLWGHVRTFKLHVLICHLAGPSFTFLRGGMLDYLCPDHRCCLVRVLMRPHWGTFGAYIYIYIQYIKILRQQLWAYWNILVDHMCHLARLCIAPAQRAYIRAF